MEQEEILVAETSEVLAEVYLVVETEEGMVAEMEVEMVVGAEDVEAVGDNIIIINY